MQPVNPSFVPLPAGTALASPWVRLGARLLEFVLTIVTLGIGWLIWAAMLAGTGQTPAKKLLGLRVIAADTLRPVGFAKMFWLRGLVGNLVVGVAFIIPPVGFVLLFMPFWDNRNQNMWDKISSTYVVTDPQDAWHTKVAPV
jgi:uncharacterized RDD family membrane protein YckC